MIVSDFKHKDCCGCTACEVICPRQAITMVPDVLGFKYPKVDIEKCIACGLCSNYCQFTDSYSTMDNSIKTKYYAARLKDDIRLMQSQSGGLFVALSDYVISIGGVVYGAAFVDHFHVAHCRASTIEERNAMCGSKYVQSDLDGVFLAVKHDLEQGRMVMFSGTPCQTAGLNAIINKCLRDNLLLVDIVCHGVPSPQAWHDYLAFIEKKKHDILTSVHFRDKECGGWHDGRASYVFAKKPQKKVTMLGAFNREVVFRESCANCHYGNVRRPSDITIGDFWGTKQIVGLTDDDKGCSVVLVNTEFGEKVFSNIRDRVIREEVSKEEAMQFNLRGVTPESPYRALYYDEYEKNGFLSAMKKYSDLGWKKQFRMHLGSIRRRFIHHKKK